MDKIHLAGPSITDVEIDMVYEVPKSLVDAKIMNQLSYNLTINLKKLDFLIKEIFLWE